MDIDKTILHKILVFLQSFAKISDSLQNYLSNIQDIKSKITDILNKLRLLLGRFDKDLLNLKFLEKLINTQQSNINTLLNTINVRILDNTDTINLAKGRILFMSKELYKIRSLLTENTGRTNQCYLDIDKLQRQLNNLHPFNIQELLATPQLPLIILKKIKKLIVRIILGITIPVLIYVISYVGSFFYEKFILKLYDKLHTTILHVLDNTKK